MAIRLKHLPPEVQKRILEHAKKGAKRPPKYRNEKVTVDGHTFDSKLEAAVWGILCLEEKAGKISSIERQVDVALTTARIIFRVDFRYRDTASGERLLVEAKGKETQTYRLKLRLFREYGEHRLRVFKGSYRRPTEVEVVVPARLR